jgi:hypothetical protein
LVARTRCSWHVLVAPPYFGALTFLPWAPFCQIEAGSPLKVAMRQEGDDVNHCKVLCQPSDKEGAVL